MPVADTGQAHQFNEANMSVRFAPLAAADHIALGVSGGSDSVALMSLIHRWLNGRRAPKVTILTVDHDLRPGSGDEARRVGVWAASLGFAHTTLIWTDEKPTSGLQAAARDARYRLMLGWCKAHGVRHLCLGHTLDDQAETVFMRLLRGSGVDGLSGMRQITQRSNITIARPLLRISRASLQAFLTQAGLSWVDDPSNDDEKFERVRVRKLLNQTDRTGLSKGHLALTARRLSRVREALDAVTDEAAGRILSFDAAGFAMLEMGDLISVPEEIGLRVLKKALIAVGASDREPRLERLEGVYAKILSDRFAPRTLAGCRLQRQGTRIVIAREPGRRGLARENLAPGEKVVWDKRFDVTLAASADHPLIVRAVGRDGWRELKATGMEKSNLPVSVLQTFPSFWQSERLIAVPHLAYFAEPGLSSMISARFRHAEVM